jgi:pyruvate dehydrogenase E2 component (dihydrolipoamide acetyltransferase)
MIKEVRLPEISENVDTGDVIKVMVSVGDPIEVDQSVVELETEKAVFEVPSTAAGVVKEILVKAGDTIKVDQVIIKVDTDASAAAGASDSDTDEDSEEDEEDEAAASEETEEDTRKKKAPAKGAPASEGSEEKKSPAKTEPAKKSAPEKPEKREKPESKTPARGASTAPRPTASPARPAVERRSGDDRRSAPASPTLRRLARELGVDIDHVTGSGPGGRILKDDLTSYARNVVSGASATVPKNSATEVTENTKWGPVVREPMSKVRQVTARVMTEAWTTIPQVTQYDKVDITEMEEIRKQYSKRLEAQGHKLTMTAILLKVAASALKVFPQFNASIDMEKEEVLYKRHYHIGVAVDTDKGLLVPVVRAVDKKNISELSEELNSLAERARARKLTPEEMEGGTFTISNLGVAILGVARARVEPVYASSNEFEPRLMLPLCVTYDHRIIDGADGARFLRWMVQALEEPLLMALEG